MLFAILALALSSCASTNYPGMLDHETVFVTDKMAVTAIRALQESDLAMFTKVGISKEGAEAWIAQSKGFTPKGNIEFIGDAMIADSYFRQYSVPSDAVGGRSEIRVWFKDDGQIVLDGIQFMPPESASRAVPSSPTP